MLRTTDEIVWLLLLLRGVMQDVEATVFGQSTEIAVFGFNRVKKYHPKTPYVHHGQVKKESQSRQGFVSQEVARFEHPAVQGIHGGSDVVLPGRPAAAAGGWWPTRPSHGPANGSCRQGTVPRRRCTTTILDPQVGTSTRTVGVWIIVLIIIVTAATVSAQFEGRHNSVLLSRCGVLQCHL